MVWDHSVENTENFPVRRGPTFSADSVHSNSIIAIGCDEVKRFEVCESDALESEESGLIFTFPLCSHTGAVFPSLGCIDQCPVDSVRRRRIPPRSRQT